MDTNQLPSAQPDLATVPQFASIDHKKKIWGVSWETATLGPVPAPGTEITVSKKDMSTSTVTVGPVHKQIGTRYILKLVKKQASGDSPVVSPSPAAAEVPDQNFA